MGFEEGEDVFHIIFNSPFVEAIAIRSLKAIIFQLYNSGNRFYKQDD